jgi:hypothetical protein
MASVAELSIVNSIHALVYPPSFPFRARFRPTTAREWSSVLVMEVKTSYSRGSARVLLNGVEIGTIGPRPWRDHFIIDYDIVSIIFRTELLTGRSFNELSMVPTSGDYLLVGNMWLHSYKELLSF